MEEKIKRGLNIYLYYWVIPFLIFFIVLNQYFPIVNVESLDIGFMVSVVSFLFGFFITISFSMIMNRVTVLKESLAVETGRLVSLFLLSKKLGNKFHERIIEIIDNYTILTLRHYTFYEYGRDALTDLFESLDLMEIKNEKQTVLANSFLYVLGEFEPIREKLEYLTKVKLLKTIKLTNYLLAFVLVMLLFLNRGEAFTNSLFILLSTTIVLILLIIEDYEDLRIGDYVSNISNSEQLFDLIGKERYYPKYLLNRVKLKKGNFYRIGFYNHSTKEEQIVRLEYKPGFNLKLNGLFERFRLNQIKK